MFNYIECYLNVFYQKQWTKGRSAKAMRGFASLNILLKVAQDHWRSFKMTPLSRACISAYIISL